MNRSASPVHVPGAPPTDAPAEVMTAAAQAAAGHDPLDDLLRQITSGLFVLTDGQGTVSKWSEEAELLFGLTAQDVLGRSLFATLTRGPLSPQAHAWRAFLEHDEPPSAPGRVSVTAPHSGGETFAMEAVFVPVKLDEGFDFSLFLEDLGVELPVNLMLMRMRQQHPVVMRALRQAIEAEAAPWDGGRTAGTLVVCRPLAPTPWVQAELATREAARTESDADLEERLTNPDPGIQGSSVNDLDDAAAVVARLLSALDRLDEVERTASSLPAQLEAARREAEARAAAAERDAQALRAELGQRADAIGPELGAVRALAQDAAGGLSALRAEIAQLREDATASARTAAARADAAEADLARALERIAHLEQELTSAGQAAVIARGEAEEARRAAQTAVEGTPDQVTQVFQQLLGMANTRNHARRSGTGQAATADRAPRAGFDDAHAPRALLGLDGRFRELNPAFSRLVGYKEREFAKAAWPSPHDRRDYQDQQEQLRRLAAGEVESVAVQSTYMHGQGLMVPVVGTLRAVAGPDGAPLHLLLEAEDRH